MCQFVKLSRCGNPDNKAQAWARNPLGVAQENERTRGNEQPISEGNRRMWVAQGRSECLIVPEKAGKLLPRRPAGGKEVTEEQDLWRER